MPIHQNSINNRKSSALTPFGYEQAGRGYTKDNTRYSFNGMEKDKEIAGDNSSLDFGARMYNSKIGRWFSADPLRAMYPHMSPYIFAGDNPIYFIDPDGKRIVVSDCERTEEIEQTLQKVNATQTGSQLIEIANKDGYIVNVKEGAIYDDQVATTETLIKFEADGKTIKSIEFTITIDFYKHSSSGKYLENELINTFAHELQHVKQVATAEDPSAELNRQKEVKKSKPYEERDFEVDGENVGKQVENEYKEMKSEGTAMPAPYEKKENNSEEKNKKE